MCWNFNFAKFRHHGPGMRRTPLKPNSGMFLPPSSSVWPFPPFLFSAWHSFHDHLTWASQAAWPSDGRRVQLLLGLNMEILSHTSNSRSILFPMGKISKESRAKESHTWSRRNCANSFTHWGGRSWERRWRQANRNLESSPRHGASLGSSLSSVSVGPRNLLFWTPKCCLRDRETGKLRGRELSLRRHPCLVLSP